MNAKEISEIFKFHKKSMEATKYCSNSNQQSYYEGMEDAFNLVLLMASDRNEFLDGKERFLLKIDNRDSTN